MDTEGDIEVMVVLVVTTVETKKREERRANKRVGEWKGEKE